MIGETMMDQVHNADFYEMGLYSYEGEEPYIFVSYSHKDVPQVRPILKRIEEEKFRFWYDDTMEIGEDFRAELQTRIEHCTAFLLFISESSMRSKYCGMEIITAFKNNKKIYPVYLNDETEIPAPLKMILENLQHVKGAAISRDMRYIDKLIAGLPTETMRSLDIRDGVLHKCKDGSRALTVPPDVSVIGESAFKNCEKLEAIDLGVGVNTLLGESFRGCKSLQTLVLPAHVRAVGESSFRDCISLTSLVVENDDIELGERAFENCAMLSSVKLADGISEIYGGVFNSCKSLVSIDLPSHLTVLGDSSFADCVRLQSIVIPPDVTKIDDTAFNGCIELSNITLGNKITKIGKNVFKDCKSLVTIQFPASISSIGTGPFRGCSNLEEILVDPKNRYFKSVDSILFNKNKSTLICYPAKRAGNRYDVPDSVTVISDWAFCNCTALGQVVIPDSVTEIGEGAFYQCTGLHSVVIPDSVVRIDDIAFRMCTELEEITIPDSVVEFGWGVFNGCDKIVCVCKDNSAAAAYCDKKNIPHHE